MHVIAFTSRKGGSGKSTLAAHLSVHADGRRPALLIDTDPQGSLALWHELRAAETPVLVRCEARQLPATLEAARRDGIAWAFVDTPPHNTGEIAAAIRELARVTRDTTGNLSPMPGIFPDYAAAVVHVREGERTLAMMRWGLPSPAFALKGKRTDPGVTNVRNTASPHWQRWLSPANRCLVPFTSFSEHNKAKGGDIRFALDEGRPLAFFAGIKVEGWVSTRKLKEGDVTTDLYAFLTTEPNREVGAVHPEVMPVILTTEEERDV